MYKKWYTKKEVDRICSDPHYHREYRQTRQQLEARTYKSNRLNFIDPVPLKSLKRVSLCMRVGEEMEYIEILYWLTGIRKGLVEFLCATHWLIRPQRVEDVWRIQYACFHGEDWEKGRNDEKIPFLLVHDEETVTHNNSRAPGLKEFDERYVEVEVRRTVAASTTEQNKQNAKSVQDASTPCQTCNSSLQGLLGADAHDTETRLVSDHAVETLLWGSLQDTHQEGQQQQFQNGGSAKTLDEDRSVSVFRPNSIPPDQTQANLQGKGEEANCLTGVEHPSGKKETRLQEIVDTPNPYTDEEMESYYDWQRSPNTKGRKVEHQYLLPEHEMAIVDSIKEKARWRVKRTPVANRALTPTEKDQSPASTSRSLLPSKSVQIGCVLFISLLFAMIHMLPEWFASAGWEREG